MIYFFDGTKYGFLTAFLAAFSDANAWLYCSDGQLALGESPIFVETNEERAKRAENRFLSFDRD